MVLSLGSLVAQGVQFAAFPLLARLYSPESFGGLALFQGVLAVLSIFASLRMEYEILQSRTGRRARSVLFAIAMVSMVSAGLSLAFTAFGSLLDYLPANLSPLETSFMAAALPLNVLYQAAYLLSTRQGSYLRLTVVRIAGAALGVGIMCGCAFLLPDRPLGLIVGSTAGVGLQALVLTPWDWLYSTSLRVLRLRLRLAFGSSGNSIRFLLPSGALDAIAQQLHILWTGHAFPPRVAGALAAHQRIVLTPSGIVAQAIADAFRARAAEELRLQGRCTGLMWRTISHLFLMGVGPYLAIQFFSRPIFRFLLGDEWAYVAEYTTLLALPFLMGFIISPISTIIFVSRFQHYALYKSTLGIGLSLAALITGSLLSGPLLAVAFYAVAQCIKYSFELVLCLRIAAGRPLLPRSH